MENIRLRVMMDVTDRQNPVAAPKGVPFDWDGQVQAAGLRHAESHATKRKRRITLEKFGRDIPEA
jgi:hypothetical protein